MSNTQPTLTAEQVLEADLADWRQLYASLHTRYTAGDFAIVLRLVVAIGELAVAAGQPPEIILTDDFVDVSLTSRDAGGVTSRDVDHAPSKTGVAAAQGVRADPRAR